MSIVFIITFILTITVPIVVALSLYNIALYVITLNDEHVRGYKVERYRSKAISYGIVSGVVILLLSLIQ